MHSSHRHWMEVSVYTAVALIYGKLSQCLFYKRLSRPQGRSGCYKGDKNRLIIPGIEPRIIGSPTPTLVAVLTELFRLEIRA